MLPVKTSSSAAVPLAPRGRIVRTQKLEVLGLRGEERRQLVERLHDIYSESVSGLSAAEFEAEVFGSNETRLALFFAGDGELAGFSYARIDRLELDGDRCAVFGAGVFFRLAYKGGPASSMFGLTEALRFKLREPQVPLAYLTRAASPAVYRLFPRTMPEVFPHPERPTPTHIERRVQEISKRRGYRQVAEHPWVVHSIAVPRRPEKLKSLDGDPFAGFYKTLNPTFAQGAALLVWTRLDALDILVGLSRLVLRRVLPRG